LHWLLLMLLLLLVRVTVEGVAGDDELKLGRPS
jgi:hypothetical protein